MKVYSQRKELDESESEGMIEAGYVFLLKQKCVGVLMHACVCVPVSACTYVCVLFSYV